MGNNSDLYHTSEFGQMYVRTDQPYYNPGQFITGNVYVNQL